MKKFIAILLAAMLLVTFAACGSKKSESNTIKDDKKLADVITAVNEKFAESYGPDYSAVAMNMDIDEQYISDFLELDSSVYDEYAGGVSMSMTNSDALIAMKAKEGKVEQVQQAFEKRLQDITAQYEFYPVSGSYDRAKSGEVYVKGDYVFLIVVGVLTNDRMDEDTVDFSSDVELVKTTIDSMFNA